MENPAPFVSVAGTPPVKQAHGHHAPETLGDLSFEGAFSRATLPNAPVAGAFLTITNSGPDDRLIGAQTTAAGRVEIHEMTMEGDVMKMRPLAEGLALPAGETVELAPGGYHLMLMDLAAPLVEGQTAEITLTFENSGEITLPFAIMAPNAKGGSGHSH